jgi:general secretion pathway protein G
MNKTQNRTGRAARSGFTLIELLLVLVILSVLAAVVVPKFARRAQQSKITGARTEIAHLGLSLDMFEIDIGRYPTTEEGLGALIEEPSGVTGWNGPYVSGNDVPTDPWENQYVYRCPGQHNQDSYDIYSKGPDGQDGGGDDIDNWTER